MAETDSETIAPARRHSAGLPGTGRLRLCFLSYRHLSQLVAQVRGEFAALADIEVIDVASDSVLEVARSRRRSGEVDAFVSAGGNAMILRESIAAPVGTIKVSGYDLLMALRKASKTSRRIGVVTYGETIEALDAAKDLLNIDVAQRCYRTPEEARQCFRELVAAGYPVFVGPSVVVELAEQHGHEGILAYSLNSVRQGIEDAIDLAHVARLEAARYDQIRAVLHNLQEAVLAVDRNNRIVALNLAMEQALGAGGVLLGGALEEVAPDLPLRETLTSGREIRSAVAYLNQKAWLVNCTPILERNEIVGALITLYDPSLIQEADTTLRAHRRSRQFPLAQYTFRDLQGSAPAFVRARETARRYATTDLTVLLTGESGTGKELFAQAIHNAGPRREKPFVAMNCAAFPESLLESQLFGYEEGSFTGSRKGGQRGLIETAHTGTLFLDEIGDMPLALQTRLLRVLQEREVMRLGGTMPIPVDVRVLAATHQQLDALVAQRLFRIDLFYRLNVLHLRLPALRERADDIAAIAVNLCQRSLRKLSSRLDARIVLTPLFPLLRACHWPGNFRELENICERLAMYFSQFERPESVDYQTLRFDCPELYDDRAEPVRPALDRGTLDEVLATCGGNRREAARRLGISRSTLWRRLKDVS